MIKQFIAQDEKFRKDVGNDFMYHLMKTQYTNLDEVHEANGEVLVGDYTMGFHQIDIYHIKNCTVKFLNTDNRIYVYSDKSDIGAAKEAKSRLEQILCIDLKEVSAKELEETEI